MQKPKPEPQVVFRKQDSLGANDAEGDTQFLGACFVDTGDLELLRDCNRAEQPSGSSWVARGLASRRSCCSC